MAGKSGATPRDTSQHMLIGGAAIIVGIMLGGVIVAIDQKNDNYLTVHAQGSGNCQQVEQSCMSQVQGKVSDPHGHCHPQWVQCMTAKCLIGGTGMGACNKDPECQSSCTEAATSQGGKISCCQGGPKHVNTCPDMIDGKCNPKQQELPGGGMGMMPMMMPMMGGMPMLPMLPMPMPKMGGGMPMPMQSQEGDPCKRSGLSSFLLFGQQDTNCPGGSGGTGTGQSEQPKSAVSSIADQIANFFGFGNADNSPAVVQEVNNGAPAGGTPSGSQTSTGINNFGDAAVLSGAQNQAIVTPGANTQGNSFAQPGSTFVSGDLSETQSSQSSSFTSTLTGILGNLGSALTGLLSRLSF